MSICYKLMLGPTERSQSANDDSFIGGVPKLPEGTALPRCTLCGAEESFFFQVALPAGSFWGGLSLAVFACTCCVDESHLIPQMLPGPLKNVDIPEGFLDSYRTNFRFLTFQTALAAPYMGYQERIKFKPFQLQRIADPDASENKIGGTPNWLQDDEYPKSYGGVTPMHFLLQLLNGFRFEIIENAPRQIELGLDGSPQASPMNYYQLFNGNRIFLFATVGTPEPLVYAVTQVD